MSFVFVLVGQRVSVEFEVMIFPMWSGGLV